MKLTINDALRKHSLFEYVTEMAVVGQRDNKILPSIVIKYDTRLLVL